MINQMKLDKSVKLSDEQLDEVAGGCRYHYGILHCDCPPDPRSDRGRRNEKAFFQGVDWWTRKRRDWIPAKIRQSKYY